MYIVDSVLKLNKCLPLFLIVLPCITIVPHNDVLFAHTDKRWEPYLLTNQ